MKKFLQKLAVGGGMGVFAAIAFTLFMQYILEDLWVNMENKTYDLRYRLRYIDASREVETGMEGVKSVNYLEDVVIVNIDERSMLADKLGVYWKWPRSYHGDIVKYLKSGNSAASVFDIHFNDADYGAKESSRIMEIFQRDRSAIGLSGNEMRRINKIIDQGVNYDQSLVDATKEAGNVIHAMILNDSANYANKSDYQERTTEKHRQMCNPGSSAQLPAAATEGLRSYPVLDGAFPQLAASAHRIGLVNVDADPDAIHRTLPLLNKFRGYVYPAISLQACLYLMSKDLSEINFIPGRFIDLGQPFYLRKAKDGKIDVSYPGVSEVMIRSLLAHRDQIEKLKIGGSVQVSEQMVVSRDEGGGVSLDILSGTLTLRSLIDLNGVDAAQFLKMPQNSPTMIGQGTGLIRTGEFEFTIVEIQNGEEAIEEIPWSTLSILTQIDGRKINALKPGASFHAAEKMTVSRTAERLETEYIYLRGKVLQELLQYKTEDIDAIPAGERVYFGERFTVPVDDYGRMRINFLGRKQRTFKTISYYDIKAERVPADYFAGKIFLIGSDAPSMFDIVGSPIDEDYPGVEIHATAMNNILSQNFMRPLSSKRMFGIVLILCLIGGLLTSFLRPLFAIILTIVTMLTYFVIAITYFDNNVFIEMVRPSLGLVGAFVGVLVFRYITEEKDKKFLKATFENYLSPELIDQMYESKQMPALGGDEGVRTAYFTDIQSFSTFSEKLGSPSKLVELLNEYLTAMTDILLAENGTLDKYEGDAIIAFFGAPMPLEDHAARACRVAINMQAKLLELRKKWVSEGDKWPEIVHNMRMRIGVNSGPIVTGNMGSKKRMNYTMMGDAVNLAARLESAAKQYGIFSMISDVTRNMIGDDFELRELDRITVVGKTEPVTIFELISEKDQCEPFVKELIGQYQEGIALYKKQEWDKANEIFTRTHELEIQRHPDAKVNPSGLYIERCAEFKANPPGADWDGVYRLTSK